MDYIVIDSTPADEDCAQIGSPDYAQHARLECKIYAQQLSEEFPDGDFRVKSFSHDFGTYYEVVAWYDEDEDPRTVAAFAAESNANPRWTTVSRERLAAALRSPPRSMQGEIK